MDGNVAKRVVAKFGGQSALAQLIGKNQSTVQYWVRAGSIPARWQKELLRIAGEQGVELTASDFQDVVPTEIKLPVALWEGELLIGDGSVNCYVLDDGRRVISRTGATSVLAGKKGGGQLEKYASAGALAGYMPSELTDSMIDFELPGVTNKHVRGLTAEMFIEVCRAYSQAFIDGKLKTNAQEDMGKKAVAFLSACSNVGLVALIDEATGYQYERAEDALQVKLRAYISDEMRKWERTFPDELWVEFARLTKWQGGLIRRPKYWGKLVNELVYDYLDPDVGKWLRENAPAPKHGRNYHQWLTSQYGLKKLVEHIWMLIGMARACKNMQELRDRKAEASGRTRVNVAVYVKPPAPGQRSLFDNIVDEEPAEDN